MEYDLLIIGGGSGGLALSKRAAETYRKKVALVDKSELGGTCVNSGCIPKKMLYNAAFLHGEGCFIYPKQKILFDWDEFRKKRKKYISMLNEMYMQRNRKHGIDFIQGSATVQKEKVTVANKEYSAEKVVIATGSFAVCPSIPGSSYCLTSDDFFEFEDLPESICIIGAGYIAVETAFVLAHFGCKVSLISRSKGVLRAFDELIQSGVKQSLIRAGVTLFDCADLLEICKEKDKISVLFKKKDKTNTIIVDRVISAIGRNANISAINQLGLEKDSRGFLKTDKTFQTSEKYIYAVGDVTMSNHMLTPVAIFTGRRLADHFYNRPMQNIKSLIEYVPTVIFSHPPSGSVGYAEKTVYNLFSDASVLLIEVFHTNSLLSDTSFPNRYKFIYGKESNCIYGIHMHGYGCDEIMQGFSVLPRNKLSFSKVLEYSKAIGFSLHDFLAGAIWM